MKQILFILLLSTVFASAFSAEPDGLRQTIEQYMQYLEKNDNSKVIGYIYPKLFEHYPKSQLKKALDEIYSDTMTVITFDSSRINKFSNIIEVEGVQYVVVDYSFLMRLVIHEPPTDSAAEAALDAEIEAAYEALMDSAAAEEAYTYDEEGIAGEDEEADMEEEVDEDDEDTENLSLAEISYGLLQIQYGEENVRFNKEKSQIDIIVSNQMYAILDPEYDGWKFLEKKEQMKPLLEKLLPKKVINKL